MSSSPQSALTGLQQNDYVTLAILTAVGYDYVLTFSNEIEYIWTKPWTWVSTLFILVRYVGLYTLAWFIRVPTLVGSSFLPGPDKTYVFVLPSLSGLFDTTDVYQTVLPTATALVGYVTAATFQILDFSYCIVSPTPRLWTTVITVPSLQITHSAAVCMLAIVQFVRQSLQIYYATKQWQLNRYMSLLVQQGILYFLAYVPVSFCPSVHSAVVKKRLPMELTITVRRSIFLFTLMNVLAAAGKLGSGLWQLILSVAAEFVPLYTLTPRFIISIRELYARDVQDNRGEGIDTGFGLLSRRGAGGTAMVFADVEQNEGVEGIEEIPRDVGMTQTE
ncbi:hypothetical protein OG21DRAFT_1497329 [Imleria badia]|nr:hypothetical protein OG21DRAFT_1497329 [Imleria badia]